MSNTTITAIEGRLAAANVTVADFCERAGIHRATWQRWKAGSHRPYLETWERAQALLAQIEAEHAQSEPAAEGRAA